MVAVPPSFVSFHVPLAAVKVDATDNVPLIVGIAVFTGASFIAFTVTVNALDVVAVPSLTVTVIVAVPFASPTGV